METRASICAAPCFVALCAAMLAAAMLAGCRERKRPWQGTPDGAVASEGEPFLPARDRGGSWLGGLGQGGSGGEGGGDGADPAQPVSRAGGLWVSCREGFRTSGEPRRDVERLGLLCGPPNGMRRIGDTALGSTSEPAPHAFAARAHACYRAFAVADHDLEAIEVTVLSSDGSRAITGDKGRVVIVEPDRPFCVPSDDELSVVVRARGGQGRYAVQLYGLPPRRPPAAR